MRKCELCNKVARMYCESDKASLCWGCDLRVHTANFLVAKHTRTLLCHACQSPTPWTGSGPKLGPTVSVCEACANSGRDGVEDGNEDDDDDAENQVVPLSLASTSATTEPTTSYHSQVTESAEEKSGAKKMRSRMWR